MLYLYYILLLSTNDEVRDVTFILVVMGGEGGLIQVFVNPDTRCKQDHSECMSLAKLFI